VRPSFRIAAMALKSSNSCASLVFTVESLLPLYRKAFTTQSIPFDVSGSIEPCPCSSTHPLKYAMKYKFYHFLTVLFFPLFLQTAVAADYYVSTSGNNDNDGLSEESPWRTISYSTDKVLSGDTVYVKAGNYGSEHVVMSVDGTAEAPIVFEGYTTVPGDNPDSGWEYPTNSVFDPAIMPLLDGGDRTEGTGITLHSRQYVVVKNFQIQNYAIGLYAWGAEHLIAENIVTMHNGDRNDSYSGKGIVFGSLANHNTIRRCIVYNASAEGISVNGDDNTIEKCKVYCDDNSTEHSAMDYYIIVSGNNNTITDSYAERVGDLDHGGHGIGFKGDCLNNFVGNSTAKNLSGAFYVRHRGCRNNLFLQCVVLDSSIGLLVRDGASDNIFRNCRVTGGTNAIAFFDTGEDDGAQWAGSDTVFENCIFEHATYMIRFHYYDRNSDTYNNSFINCIFNDGEYLFNVERDNHDNRMVNSIVTNVRNYKTGTFDLNFSFSHSLFWENGFLIPAGDTILEKNPLFSNIAWNDYHLTILSPCIDAGDLLYTPTIDLDGAARPQGARVDIGPYEFPSANHSGFTGIFLLLQGVWATRSQ